MDQVAVNSDLKKTEVNKTQEDDDFQRRLKQLQEFRGEQ